MLDEAVRRRVVLVTAGPGFGKTTLLAAWSRVRRHAWYSLDVCDGDLQAMSAGVLAAVRRLVPVPDLGLGGLFGPESTGTAVESLAAMTAQRLAPVVRDGLVLVLDDAHRLPAGSAGAALLDALLRHLPDGLRVVIAGNDGVPVRSQALRAGGLVTEVGAGTLAFTATETAALLTSVLGTGAESLAEPAHRLTAGWPAAVRILAESLDRVGPEARVAHLQALALPGGALADYLAEEVFAHSRPEVRTLLAATGELDSFSAAMCRAGGLPADDADLARLARHGLLRVVGGAGAGTTYQVPPLIAAACRTGRWGPDATLRRRVCGAAAEAFTAQGRTAEALQATRALGEPAAVADFLTRHGEQLLAAGGTAAVAQAVAELPAVMFSPAVHLIAGQALQVCGDWPAALRHYRHAARAVPALPAAAAWRMGLIHYSCGELDEALAVFLRGDREEGPGDDGPGPGGGCDDASRAHLLSWTATVYWRRQDHERCRVTAARALALAESSGDDAALAAAYTASAMVAVMDGDRPGCVRHYAAARQAADRAGDVLALLRVRNNLGSRLLEDGAYQAAVEEFDEVIRLAQTSGWLLLGCLALHNRGLAHTGLGRLGEACADFSAALRGYRALGSRMAAYPQMRLGDVYRIRGDVERARAAYEEAVAEATASGDAQGKVPALAGLARILAETEPEHADRLITLALACGPGVARLEACLAAGWISLVRGDTSRAGERAAEALTEARRRHHLPRLAEALELAGVSERRLSRLTEAAALRRDIDDPIGAAVNACLRAQLRHRPSAPAAPAAHQLRTLGVRLDTSGHAAGPLRWLAARTNGSPVEVRTLGGFQVLHDGVPVTAERWRSRKAREALMVLIARRGRRISRELLGEALWPGEVPDRVANRLSVALSTLRGVLDPQRLHPPDHHIRADKDGVWLGAVEVDVLAFLDVARDALGARPGDRGELAGRYLAAAETRYTGDFLDDQPYADWAAPLREEARTVYLQVVRALAGAATRTGDTDRAVHYLLRLLERDPYDEDAHHRLIAAHRAAGRHGEASRRHQAYTALMSELAPSGSAGTGW
jgi:DNA-binding SARP family transcriptional activator